MYLRTHWRTIATGRGRLQLAKKKRKKGEHIHNHLLGRVKKLRTLETTFYWIVRFSRLRYLECLGSSGLTLESLTNFHLHLMSTDFYLKLISNSVFQSSFKTIFCWQTSTTKINNDKMIIQKAEPPKSLHCDFTVAKRFMKTRRLILCCYKANLDELKPWVCTTSVGLRLDWRSFPKWESVEFLGGKIYCLVILNSHQNLRFDLYSWRQHSKWHRISWYLGKRQRRNPWKVDRKFKRKLLSCHSCLGCSKERLRSVFVTDAISTSHAFLPKLFSSFIDGKVKFVNGIIVSSTKRFPVSWTANMFDRTTAPRPETDDRNRLVLNVPGQQSDSPKLS